MSIMAYTDEGYKRFTVRPIGVDEFYDGCHVLTLRERKIWASFYYLKDGKEVHVSGGRHVPAGKVFGIIVDNETPSETNDR